MHNQFKKIMATILAVVVLLGMLPTSVFAEDIVALETIVEVASEQPTNEPPIDGIPVAKEDTSIETSIKMEDTAEESGEKQPVVEDAEIADDSAEDGVVEEVPVATEDTAEESGEEQSVVEDAEIADDSAEDGVVEEIPAVTEDAAEESGEEQSVVEDAEIADDSAEDGVVEEIPAVTEDAAEESGEEQPVVEDAEIADDSAEDGVVEEVPAVTEDAAEDSGEVIAEIIDTPILLESAEVVGTEDIIPESTAIAFTTTVVSTKADVVFVVDSTGSMSDEINNVRENLNGFTQTLDESGVNFRIAVVEYKDITVSGESESTKVLTNETGEMWFNSAEEVAEILSKIYVDGGGDTPETAVDALGAVMNDLAFRKDASKFAILLTDAGYKNNNDYGIADMAEAIDQLKEAGINTSVISDTDYESTYHDLYTETDGIFCDINGDFADELAIIAEHIEEVTTPVRVILTTVPGERNDAEAKYALLVAVEAMDEEKTATDVSLTLSVPENFVVTGSLVKTIEAVVPGSTWNIGWGVSVPVLKEDANYTWSVNANSDDFATGTVISAQDTFQVVGRGETDYSWVFGEDNYSFLNSYDAFGNGSYYISDEDLEIFLSQLRPTEISTVAAWFGKNGSTIDLINNDLITWAGSCYGMSLSAALFKVSLLNSGNFTNASGKEAAFTHDIEALKEGTNSQLESMINVYHISQATPVAINSSKIEEIGSSSFSTVAGEMWNKAVNIGAEGSSEQPFIVRLRSDAGGHAVVCYGAEEGEWSIGGFLGIGATKYSKRLLIADPNYSDGSKTYIYLSDDNTQALYFSDKDYDRIGYRDASLSELNQYDYYDAMANHKIEVAANKLTDIVMSIGSAKAVILAGQVIEIDEGMTISEYKSENALAGEEDIVDNGNSLYRFNSDEDITIAPYEDGGTIDTLVSLGNYSVKLSGAAASMTMSQSGDIRIDNASGDISLQLAVNDSAFEFITINGTANGEVVVSIKDGKLDVSGAIENYTVANMTLKKSDSDAEVNGEDNARFVIEDGKVVAYVDKDGDGVYETKVNGEENESDTEKDIVTKTETKSENIEAVEEPEVMKLWVLNSEKSLEEDITEEDVIVGLAFEDIFAKEGLEIIVDNEQLVADIDYTVNEGIIVLNPEFLNHLQVGFHTVETNDGYIEKFVVSAIEPMVWEQNSSDGLTYESILAEAELELFVSDSEQMVDEQLVIESDYSIENGVVVLKTEFLNKLEIGFYVLKTSSDYSEVFQITE